MQIYYWKNSRKLHVQFLRQVIARFQFLSCFFPAQQSLTKDIFRVYNSISNRFTRFFMIYGWYMIYLLSQMWQDRINFWVIFKKTSYILVVYISGVLVHFTPCSILGGRSISTFCPLGYFWAYIYIIYRYIKQAYFEFKVQKDFWTISMG